MAWAEFEGFALDGPKNEILDALFWPEFLACMAYLVIAPIREAYEKYWVAEIVPKGTEIH